MPPPPTPPRPLNSFSLPVTVSHLFCLDALLGGLQRFLSVELVHQVVGLEARYFLLQVQAVGLNLLDAIPKCSLSVIRLLFQVPQLSQKVQCSAQANQP